MTEVASTTKFVAFAERFFSAGSTEIQLVNPRYHRAYQKRYWAQVGCSRFQESCLPGADLAAEYVYGKYIRDLSTSIIQQSSRVILHFLHFLEREETSIYALNRQDISKFLEYEQGRGQKTQSVVNYLRTEVSRKSVMPQAS